MRPARDLGPQRPEAAPLGDRDPAVANRAGTRRRCATTTRSSAPCAAAGFTVEMTAHAYALLDSYIYGFALQEAALPFNGPETVTEVAEQMMEQYPADEYPHLAEMATKHILNPATTSATSSSSGST